MEIQALQMTPVSMHATSHLGETIEKPAEKSFGAYLKDALSEVNHLQLVSEEQNALARQKADIALQLTMQMRNRAVSAYQEIMRMQV